MKVLIQHWDAVELFCLIISKIEGKRIEHYHNYEILQKALDYYSNTEIAQKASISSLKTTNTLSGLVRRIRTKEPVVLTKSEYNTISNYIGQENPVALQELNITWTPKNKASLFLGRWWLYSYDELNGEAGIVRSVIYFKPFNKAVVDSLRNNIGSKQRYVGKYHMYGSDATYMIIAMRTEETIEKDLHMLFYIGAEVPTLSIGQYHNVDGTIFSGTAVIQRSTGRGHTIPKFFPFKDKSADQDTIPSYIWEYFKEKCLNILRVPASITNEEKFIKWLKMKRNNDDNNNKESTN